MSRSLAGKLPWWARAFARWKSGRRKSRAVNVHQSATCARVASVALRLRRGRFDNCTSLSGCPRRLRKTPLAEPRFVHEGGVTSRRGPRRTTRPARRMTPAPSTLHAMAHDEVTTPLVVLERPRVRVASRVVIVSGRSNPSPRDGHRESETARSGARGCRVTQTKLALSGGPGWRRERERQPQRQSERQREARGRVGNDAAH